MRESSRLSDYWQQRTKSQLCRVHVTPRETHKSYLNGSTLTMSDTWLGNSKGRDCEEWAGEDLFLI